MTVISEKRTGRTGSLGRGYVQFELRSGSEPSMQDVADSQVRCGYNPAGYGGPYRVKTVKEDDVYVTTWECSGSCD